jgi:drug/metabolite transporter (DMT)-like permease
LKTKHFLLIAAILQVVWGFVPSASQLILNEIPVELYIAIRWTISGLIFAVYLIANKQWRALSLKDWLRVSCLGIMGYGVASFGTLYSLKIGGVTNFALMGALSPVITSVLSIWILRERPQKLFYFALPLAVMGLALLVVGKYQISSMSVAATSALLILGAYILDAFVFVFSKKFKERMSTAQYLAVTQIATAVFMWILQLTSFHQFDQLPHLSLTGASAAIFVSVVACVLCYAVLYWLLDHVDGHRLALFDGFHTLSATFFGYFLFQETLGPLMIVGGVLILISLVAGNLPSKATQETPE